MSPQREDIRTGADTEFHMLRHFSEVDPSMLASIRGKGRDDKEIGEMLKAPGSRFHASFARSIEGLLDVLFSRPFRCNEGVTGNLELEWSFPGNEYHSGVGTRSVVSIEILTEEERRSIYSMENRGMDLLHLDVGQLPVTWECALVLKKIDNGCLFITAFPGTPALPLPHPGMSADVHALCKEFWQSHVFLSLKA